MTSPGAKSTRPPGTLAILIAPNLSEQMGGEAIKALQIFQEFKKLRANTLQITHERNKDEVARLGLTDVHFVRDTWISKFLWRSVVLRWFVNFWFGRRAVALGERLAAESNPAKQSVVLFQTEPNSPVLPRFTSRRYMNCFGPINGNIYYPRAFRHHERLFPKLRRIFHLPSQRLHRALFPRLSRADLILCAGGDRTRLSLIAAGCSPDILLDSLDCGIRDEFLERPRVEHNGVNTRFVHFGRLVFHKCTHLIIESLARTRSNIELDIVGKGPELERCMELVNRLGLADRVRFLGWYTRHEELFDSFKDYRGLVLPSIEDANGIVVQEAMALGLPAICMDWGGPQLLVQHGKTGFLVKPTSIDEIIDQLAEYMDRLALDGALAERMAVNSREAAETWRWSVVADNWLAEIDRIASSRD